MPSTSFGVFNDAAVAAKAHELGEGAIFTASFNSQEHQEFSLPFDCEAKVVKLSDGRYVGRRGVLKNVSSDMGPSALLDLGGIQLVVISNRCQCMDPRQFEMFGLDIAQARVVVVKSRGHFRGGFDEFFKPDQIYEVDCPGLTSPVLANFTWTKLPRPVYPLDEETTWTPPHRHRRSKESAMLRRSLLALAALPCSADRRWRSRTRRCGWSCTRI